MPPVLFDSSVYISALRRRDTAIPAARRLADGAILWLSAVVLEELYAGISDGHRGVVERLDRDFRRANRVLIPNLTDWTSTGRVLAELGAKYGYEGIGKGRLTNDALIAMSACRKGIIVLTMNERDFARIAEFRPFRFELL